jgi:hypothetical protein
MFTSRRMFLGSIACFSVIVEAALSGRSAIAVGALKDASKATLAAFLDTLIPADDYGPGATMLGTDKVIFTLAEANEGVRNFVQANLEWLDEKAGEMMGATFADLSAKQREVIVAEMEAEPPGSSARRFFDSVRVAALNHFYTQPQAWEPLGYRGPPQPDGFMDYTEAPEDKGE